MTKLDEVNMNRLYYGDNLQILREYIKSETVDLIYLDPPFNSKRNYNVLFKNETGEDSQAQITAFKDTWHWDTLAVETYLELATNSPLHISTMISALRNLIGTNQMMAYLVMMTARLIELHRVLKPTGSLYLHCDSTASHYLKIILDTIFGVKQFKNEIIWQRTNAHNMKTKGYVRANDTILFYTKTSDFVFNTQFTAYGDKQLKRYKVDENGRLYKAENLTFSTVTPTRQFEWRGTKPGPNRSWGASLEQLENWYNEGRILLKKNGSPRLDGLKVYLDSTLGKPVTTNWTDIERISNTSKERLGYPTQKPLTLLERIICASSNEGDVILDPFCGCGTATTAAQKLKRKWLGIDITHLAIALQKYRLKDMFGLVEKRDYEVIGEPTDLEAAYQLARENRYQFQWWALSLIQARPLGEQEGNKQGKKGKDRGIDGKINFIDDSSINVKEIIIQVKSGKIKPADIRDLHGVISREENAVMGIFITLEPPTKEMKIEATSAGKYISPGWKKDFPLIQIITIEELLNGTLPNIPPTYGTFRQAERVTNKGLNIQPELDILE